jgi:hypothetical protein
MHSITGSIKLPFRQTYASFLYGKIMLSIYIRYLFIEQILNVYKRCRLKSNKGNRMNVLGCSS